MSSPPAGEARRGASVPMAKRVIVLGGGVGGMSAAHELAERDLPEPHEASNLEPC